MTILRGFALTVLAVVCSTLVLAAPARAYSCAQPERVISRSQVLFTGEVLEVRPSKSQIDWGVQEIWRGDLEESQVRLAIDADLFGGGIPRRGDLFLVAPITTQGKTYASPCGLFETPTDWARFRPVGAHPPTVQVVLPEIDSGGIPTQVWWIGGGVVLLLVGADFVLRRWRRPVAPAGPDLFEH